MLQAAPQDNSPSMILVEAGLTAITIAAAFCLARPGSSIFSRIERPFVRLARRQGLAVAAVGLATLLLRLAILPLSPIPLPFVPDDFSFLLAADTFAHGRLTNPTPVMWTHFETIHISMQPTYMSMYFPGQGLIMAAGKVFFGHPWFGILIASSLMCAGICWMLQAWLPPTWALLGGIIAMLRLGLFSYWVNTYTGGGPIAALGGALVLGALPRLMKTARIRYGVLMAIGMILLVLTRPYEGLLLCLPVAVALGRWIFTGKNRPSRAALMCRAALPLALLIAAMAWLGYYDYRAFGNPLTLPYTLNRATYAIAPYWIWQSRRPDPGYRHEAIRHFYEDVETTTFEKLQTPPGFAIATFIKVFTVFLFFAGFALLPPLIMIRRVFLDRRIRFLILCVAVLVAGMVIEIFLVPHYLAPFTAVFYAIGLQAMRHLHLWSPEGRPVGAMLVRLTVILCIVLAGMRLFTGPLHIKIAEWPPGQWAGLWYGPEHFGTERARIEAALEHLPGKQLVILRWSPHRNSLDQWVYNEADIDASKVVWAREMSDSDNLELIHYYADRTPWLVDMGTQPATVSPFPLPAQPAATRR
jgi:hypothetical protein